MTTYARLQGDLVVEVIRVDEDPPIEDRYHPDIIAELIQLKGGQVTNVTEGYTYDGSSFSPPQAAPEPAPEVFTRRRHIYERATKEECATLAATLEQADDQMAQIFMASDWIDHSNALFAALQSAIVQAVGQDRAAVLLAPSIYPEV
jgi:hypothetical protein